MEGKPVDDVSEQKGDYQEKISELKAKNKRMYDEFNIQRAKMKELFVQKETECIKLAGDVDAMRTELNDLRSQFLVVECKNENEMQLMDRKAQEEIASLQQLVQETIEESALCKTDLDKLREENVRLTKENRDLREEVTSHQDTASLAPVISHVKKTLARKLGADPGGSHDNLDDSMRKAQEDAEVLRSLVVPLEEEIKALKEKLRSTDDELQSYRNSNQVVSRIDVVKKSRSPSPKPETKNQKHSAQGSMNKSTSMDHFQCDMCQNYELNLVQSQKVLNEEKEYLNKIKKSLNDAREDLRKEATLRRQLEEQWQEKREAHKEEVQLLTNLVKKSEKDMINLEQQFLDTKEDINKQLLRLSDDRKRANKHMEILQGDNDFLSGKYLATSEELESQNINLPNTVEELQEMLLKQQDELIQARVAVEFEKRKCVSYVDETQILRDQLETVTNEKRDFERKVQTHITSLEERLKNVMRKEQTYEIMKEKFSKSETDMNNQISELRVQVVELTEANKKLDEVNADIRAKVKILQDDLSTSEHVQKDFVKLSQSLQIELEKFRGAETQVRWQDEEDVEKCSNCKVVFTVTCRKHHCRHCGIIYCEKCLTKTVPSGPRKKPARVCDMCHTLLTPNKAPHFSQDPPQSPT